MEKTDKNELNSNENSTIYGSLDQVQLANQLIPPIKHGKAEIGCLNAISMINR